jgi:hypothetical protein
MAAAKKTEPAKKPAAAPAKKEAPQLPVKAPQRALSTEVHDYGDMAGGGFEGTTHEDYAMPFLNLLQALSPEVGAEGEDAQVEGAKPGMLINSVTKELYDGKEGVVFVPVTTTHNYVEWRPRESGGGIVGRHEIGSELVEACKKSAEKFGSYKTDEGNDLIETFCMIGYTLESEDATEPKDIVVVPFTSTKIKVYKRIMQMLRTYKGRPPLFANRLRITSVAEKNNHGAFFNFDIKPVQGGVGPSLIPPVLGEEQHPLLVFGQQLGEQVRTGARRMADESTTGAGAASGGEPVDANGKPLF